MYPPGLGIPSNGLAVSPYALSLLKSNTPSVAPSDPTSLFGNPQTFSAAARTQSSDYDRIMQGYEDFAKSYDTNPINAGQVIYSGVSPTLAPYAESEDVKSSIKNLSDLATTGGYTPQNIADIRARDISPIRSIYANAQQEVERQRALGGGYSPNFNAVQAQMARDESDKIADTTTAVNARIAQDVAGNRIAASSPYASAASAEASRKTGVDMANANIINQVNEANAAGLTQSLEFNSQVALEAALANRQGRATGLGGQLSLYGTTPALSNLFGNQVMQANNANLSQQDLSQRQFGQVLGFAR